MRGVMSILSAPSFHLVALSFSWWILLYFTQSGVFGRRGRCAIIMVSAELLSISPAWFYWIGHQCGGMLVGPLGKYGNKVCSYGQYVWHWLKAALGAITSFTPHQYQDLFQVRSRGVSSIWGSKLEVWISWISLSMEGEGDAFFEGGGNEVWISCDTLMGLDCLWHFPDVWPLQ